MGDWLQKIRCFHTKLLSLDLFKKKCISYLLVSVQANQKKNCSGLLVAVLCTVDAEKLPHKMKFQELKKSSQKYEYKKEWTLKNVGKCGETMK